MHAHAEHRLVWEKSEDRGWVVKVKEKMCRSGSPL